jgi:PAS domain S-box-containing protein
MEYRLRRFDGQYRWIVDCGMPHFAADRSFDGYVGSCVDITDQKRAEQDLQASELRMRFVLESTNALPWVADCATWCFTYVGPQAPRLLGYPVADWFEKDFWVSHIYGEDRDAAVAFCLEHSQHDTDYEFYYRMVHADGGLVWIHDIVNVVSENGMPRTLRGFMIDVTERRVADDELRALRDQIARVGRVSMLGQLAASIAHEVNQPLCAIVSNARAVEQMLASGQDPEEIRAAMNDISQDGQRASDVITRMRKMFQHSPMPHALLDINELIREIIPLITNELLRRGVSLKVELAEGLPPVLGDRVQLQQVILNLLHNGAESMEHVTRDQRELSIRSLADSATAITVSVRDGGIGIDAAAKNQLFDAFFTTKPGGMGMGLAISKSIISSHGGRIWLEPNWDRGMTFSFSLPPRQEKPA